MRARDIVGVLVWWWRRQVCQRPAGLDVLAEDVNGAVGERMREGARRAWAGDKGGCDSGRGRQGCVAPYRLCLARFPDCSNKIFVFSTPSGALWRWDQKRSGGNLSIRPGGLSWDILFGERQGAGAPYLSCRPRPLYPVLWPRRPTRQAVVGRDAFWRRQLSLAGQPQAPTRAFQFPPRVPAT